MNDPNNITLWQQLLEPRPLREEGTANAVASLSNSSASLAATAASTGRSEETSLDPLLLLEAANETQQQQTEGITSAAIPSASSSASSFPSSSMNMTTTGVGDSSHIARLLFQQGKPLVPVASLNDPQSHSAMDISHASSGSVKNGNASSSVAAQDDEKKQDGTMLFPIAEEIFSFTDQTVRALHSQSALLRNLHVMPEAASARGNTSNKINAVMQAVKQTIPPLNQESIDTMEPLEYKTATATVTSSSSDSGSSSSNDLSSTSLYPPTSSHEHMWRQRYSQLCDFHKQFGHSLVPMNWSCNPSLAHWVKRQRYKYKLKYQQLQQKPTSKKAATSAIVNPSTLTVERERLLAQLGFVWDSHRASWQERFHELEQFHKQFGHSNVPKNYPPNQKLSVWVKCQRRQYKLLKQGQKSNMTDSRIVMLESLNFCFYPRRGDGRPMLVMASDPSTCEATAAAASVAQNAHPQRVASLSGLTTPTTTEVAPMTAMPTLLQQVALNQAKSAPQLHQQQQRTRTNLQLQHQLQALQQQLQKVQQSQLQSQHAQSTTSMTAAAMLPISTHPQESQAPVQGVHSLFPSVPSFPTFGL